MVDTKVMNKSVGLIAFFLLGVACTAQQESGCRSTSTPAFCGHDEWKREAQQILGEWVAGSQSSTLWIDVFQYTDNVLVFTARARVKGCRANLGVVAMGETSVSVHDDIIPTVETELLRKTGNSSLFDRDTAITVFPKLVISPAEYQCHASFRVVEPSATPPVESHIVVIQIP